ncbi:MAG: zinc ribbon domain-containing protein [Candidatus Thorarchaeota archaeon]
MKRTLPHLAFATLLLGVLCLSPITVVQGQTWTDDGNFAFLLEVNNVSAADSNSESPIPVNISEDLSLELSIDVAQNITIQSMTFLMQYMGIPLINQEFPVGLPVPAGTAMSLMNESISLGDMLGIGGIDLLSGTILGEVSFIYSLLSDPGTNITLAEDFVLRLGATGPAAIMSVNGLITLGFTVMAVFSLLLALDEFQKGILAARKMRGAKRGSDVGIFPTAVVLRRKPKKDGEKISKDELVRRVTDAAGKSWDHAKCPKCGKKWKKNAQDCQKCGISESDAVRFFSEDIAEYAPRAMKVVKPKSKVTVGAFSKRVKLKPAKGGALAAALTDMGIFQTRSVKVPLMKVAFSGMTIAGFYWSWLQILSGATPTLFDSLLYATAGLVVSVLVAYFMNFLARVPKLGYD